MFKLITSCVLNAEDLQCFHHQKRRNMKWILKEGGRSGDAVAKLDAVSKARIFAMIAKISPGLRKFRNHSENFAILAKLRFFARLAKFR